MSKIKPHQNQIKILKDHIADLQEYLDSEGCRYCLDAYKKLQLYLQELDSLLHIKK